MNPDPVAAGVILAGTDPAVVDLACAVLMGFDPEAMPIVRQAFDARGWPVASALRAAVELRSDEANWCGALATLDPRTLFAFEPHFGWKGHIEADWRR